MKFFLNIKLNIALLLLITILAMFLLNVNDFVNVKGSARREGFTWLDEPDRNSDGTARANMLGDELSKDLDKVGGGALSGLNQISAFIDTTPKVIIPPSRHVYGDGVTGPDTITTEIKPDTSYIITDGCSKKSILKSDYEADICTTYAGEYKELDKKCKALSNENCNLSSCCISLNGTKCVAGNASGPTYLTDQGNAIDYYYYLYRNTCYGKGCDDASNKYKVSCGKYADNSTGISKACMVQMFNDAGCKNPNPKFVINEEYTYFNSKTSKKYMQNDLKDIAKNLLSDIAKGNPDSRIKCQADPNDPCDQFLSTNEGISKSCMIKMYNDAGCPNPIPPLITDSFVNNYRNTNKNDLKKIITSATQLIKQTADAPGAIQTKRTLCYGA